jgi:hypothetical protein
MARKKKSPYGKRGGHRCSGWDRRKGVRLMEEE